MVNTRNDAAFIEPSRRVASRLFTPTVVRDVIHYRPIRESSTGINSANIDRSRATSKADSTSREPQEFSRSWCSRPRAFLLPHLSPSHGRRLIAISWQAVAFRAGLQFYHNPARPPRDASESRDESPDLTIDHLRFQPRFLASREGTPMSFRVGARVRVYIICS